MTGADKCISLTQSVCPVCGEIVNAKLVTDGRSVFMQKLCPRHQSEDVRIASSLQWYHRTVNSVQTGPGADPRRPVKKGCPHDCGLCGWHEGTCSIPVFSITNACNMNCPICFTYNRPDKLYYMTKDEMRDIVDRLVESFISLDLINITGGEPTLHPGLTDLIGLARRQEIGRITLNSNGLRLAEDEDLVRNLAELGVYVILSFNTLNPEVSRKIHGSDITGVKLKALANLEKYGIPTTLLTVAIKGVNDSELGSIARLVMEKDFLRSFTIQNMTFTGQGGSFFRPQLHITIDEVIERLAGEAGLGLENEDFRPHPRYHPLCYSTCYIMKDGNGKTSPLSRLLTSDEYTVLLGGGYLLHPDDRMQKTIKIATERMWARGDDPGTLKIVKNLISGIYPPGKALSIFERQRIAEKYIKTIYIHSHMDAFNFDLARLCRCGDLVPQTDGRHIPACSYNMFYRKLDDRFYATTV